MLQPRHAWTDDNRILLCLLRRSYERKHVVPIWSYIFRTQLSIEGFVNGISKTALDSQYSEMKGPGAAGYEIYTHIIHATQNIIEREYGTYLHNIRRAIQDLNLNVAFRTSKLAKQVKAQRLSIPRRQRAISIPVTVPSELTSINEVTSIRPVLRSFLHHPSPYFTGHQTTTDMTDEVRTHERVETPVPPVLRISTDSHGNQSRQHPILLFRATPIIANFRSRRHADPAAIIDKPFTFASQAFRKDVWPHLERNRKYPSPFISLAQNPRNALRRVETSRSEEPDREMFLAIFAFNDLQADSQTKFGADSGPYLVRNLFTTEEVSGLPDGYKGAGEWLMYGSIDCEPIAILDSSQGIKLARSLRRFAAKDAGALLDIHESLRSIPNKWKQCVAYNFLLRYCSRSRLPIVGSRPYTLLMQVIEDGEISSLARLTACCERIATEEVEARWVVVDKEEAENDDEEEEEEEEGDEQSPEEVLYTSSVRPRMVQVNVPHRSQLSSRSVVSNHLNTLARQRYNSTPMWSPDSSEADNDDEAGDKATNMNDDWDMIAEDLETAFTKDFPSAARKLVRPVTVLPQAHGIARSIERDDQVDSFTAELLRSAYGPSSLSTPSRLRGKATSLHTDKTAPALPRSTKPGSATSSFIDLTDEPTTPVKRSAKAKKRTSPTDTDDEDIIIAGSGRPRQRVRLTMRSLSVQDDEDFMSALESA